MDTAPRVSTERAATVLYVVTQDAVLVQSKQHEGEEVYDAFGVSSRSDDRDGAARLLKRLIGPVTTEDPVVSKVLLHIEKPDQTVDLTVTAVCYRVSKKVDASEGSLWLAANQIAREPRLRSDDKLLLEALLLQAPFDMEIWETQLERWIDAKVIKHTERTL